MMAREQSHILEIIALCLILALATSLRLANAASNPGWYTDESTHRRYIYNNPTGWAEDRNTPSRPATTR
jgi:hypothetical protein